MSTVELAVRKVRKLSNRRARELLGWLDEQQRNGPPPKRRLSAAQRKAKARRAMRKLKAWEDSIRFTTDWEPPRMSDEFLQSLRR